MEESGGEGFSFYLFSSDLIFSIAGMLELLEYVDSEKREDKGKPINKVHLRLVAIFPSGFTVTVPEDEDDLVCICVFLFASHRVFFST